MITIPLMSLLARLHGASWKPKRFPAGWAFAIPFGVAAYISTGSVLFGIVGVVISYLGIQLGHGNFYAMQGSEIIDQPESIEKIIRPVCRFLRIDHTKPIYSWLCMGVKGLIIGLPAFPNGLILSLAWPFSYWLSFRVLKRESMPAEWISGAFAGAVLWSIYA